MRSFYLEDFYDDDEFYEDFYDDDEIYYVHENYEDDDSLLGDLYQSGEQLIGELVRRKDNYTALASKNILIADIDCGHAIEKPLQVLKNFVDRHRAAFRVYKTLNGMRYIHIDLMYQGVNRSAIDTLQALGSDPKYVAFCRVDGRFMARVTPKVDEHGMKDYLEALVAGKPTKIKTCELIGTFASKQYAFIASKPVDKFIQRHDSLCQTYLNLPLA